MRAGKHIVANKHQPFIAEPIANNLAAMVPNEGAEIVNVDDLHSYAPRLNNAALEPAPVDPFAHFGAADVQSFGKQRHREPFPALANTQAQPVKHGTDGCWRTAEDSRGFFYWDVLHQFNQTLLLARGPLAITALFGHAEPTQETQARVTWVA